MRLGVGIGLILAAVSTTLTNLAYLREHDAAAALPALSLRRPLQSLHLLLADRSWLGGFAMESGGFAFYAAALALAPLALVQSIGAGGIGVLAYVSARVSHRPLRPAQAAGAAISALGLLLMAISLAKNTGERGHASTAGILAWLGGSAALAFVVLMIGSSRRGDGAVACAIAGGILFSIGDISTKLATQGGTYLAFVLTLVLGYALGTSLIQLGYQRGGALTVAGLATLLTNALPIAAATIVLRESVPSGILGAARVVAFVAVTVGAILLAGTDSRSRASRGSAPK